MVPLPHIFTRPQTRPLVVGPRVDDRRRARCSPGPAWGCTVDRLSIVLRGRTIVLEIEEWVGVSELGLEVPVPCVGICEFAIDPSQVPLARLGVPRWGSAVCLGGILKRTLCRRVRQSPEKGPCEGFSRPSQLVRSGLVVPDLSLHVVVRLSEYGWLGGCMTGIEMGSGVTVLSQTLRTVVGTKVVFPILCFP